MMHLPVVAVLLFLKVVTVSSSNFASPGCPSASWVEWQDSMLQKMVRTELTTKDYMERLEKALETLKVQTEVFEETKTALEEKYEEISKLTSERLNMLERLVLGFEERLITPAVAFNVKDAVTTSPAYQDIIRFEHVLLNEAGAYDRVIGIFTAPANGTYLFGAQVCSTSSKFGWFEIAVDAKENVILCISDYENQTGHTSTSGTAVTKLNKGQRVWVQNRRSQTTLYNAVACWNQFMGVLIHI